MHCRMPALAIVIVCVVPLHGFSQSSSQGHSRVKFHGIALDTYLHHSFVFRALLDSDVPERMRALQKELRITPKNLASLKVVDTRRGEQLRLFGGRPEPDNTDPKANSLVYEDQMNQAEESLLLWLPEVWTSSQETRFEQLCCQFSGPMALRLKHYAAKTGLSEGTRLKIDELVKEYYDLSKPIMAEELTARNDEAAAAARRKLTDLAYQLDEKILELLSTTQKNKWIRIMGPEFDWRLIFPER